MGRPFQSTKLDEREAWRLYGLGKSDAEIAAACGVHKNTIQGWRNRYMLKSNRKKPRKMTQLELDAIAARKAGMTYGEYKSQQRLGLIGGKK